MIFLTINILFAVLLLMLGILAFVDMREKTPSEVGAYAIIGMVVKLFLGSFLTAIALVGAIQYAMGG